MKTVGIDEWLDMEFLCIIGDGYFNYKFFLFFLMTGSVETEVG